MASLPQVATSEPTPSVEPLADQPSLALEMTALGSQAYTADSHMPGDLQTDNSDMGSSIATANFPMSQVDADSAVSLGDLQSDNTDISSLSAMDAPDVLACDNQANAQGTSIPADQDSSAVIAPPSIPTSPITMTGKAYAKLQRIMDEKNLDLDKAMEYFFSLHQKVSMVTKPKGQRGRPKKGSRPSDPTVKAKVTSPRISNADGGTEFTTKRIEEDEKQTTELGSDMSSGRRKSRRTIRKPHTDQYAYFDNLKKEDIDSDLDVEALDAEGNEDGEDVSEQDDPTVNVHDITEPKRTRAKRRKIVKEEFLTAEEQRTLVCSVCQKQCESKTTLYRHKWNFHDVKPRPYVCQICGYGALYNCDYQRHMRIHSRETEQKCPVCDFTTIWKKNLDVHMQLHDPEREPWKCDICGEQVYSQQKIKQHRLTHDANAVKCDLCDSVFENQRFLDMHRQTHVKEKPYKCEHCRFSTGFKMNLRNHLFKRHGIGSLYAPKKKAYKCDQCSKVFINEERRMVHRQLHDAGVSTTDPRPDDFVFCCPYGCDYRSKDIDHVVKHMVIHSENKTYQCEQCDYATKWKKDLANHVLRHTGQKNERCDICGYTCYTKCRLKVHMNKHNDKKEHMCEWCGQYFKHKNLLKIHTLYHTGEPKFKCDLCDFATITESRLKKHRLSHSEDRLYRCDICEKTFKQAHHLNQHRDAVHLGKPNYRQRKMIAYTTTTELGEQRIVLQTDTDGSGETELTAEDLSDCLKDHQVVEVPQEANDNCQYVMVQTPNGYRFVSVALPPKDETAAQDGVSETVIEEPAQALQQLSQGGATMEEAQILLPQIDDEQHYVYVTIPEGESIENIAAVETLVALQP